MTTAAEERPPLLPAQRALEAALVAVVVAFSLWRWSAGVSTTPDLGGAAPDTMQRLAELQREGRGQLPAALLTAATLGALGAFGLVLLRLARAARGVAPPGELTAARLAAAAAAWWTERTAALRQAVATVSVGHFLVAFGAVQLAQLPVVPLMPGGQVVVDGAAVDVRLGAAHEVAPVGTAVKASFRPTLGGMHVRVSGGPVRVGGASAGPGALEVPDGATVEVGAVRVIVRGPPPARHLAVFALAQALSLLALLGGVAVLGGRALRARLGLTTRGLGRELRRGALALLAVLPVYFVAAALWSALGEALGLPPQGHALIELLEREGRSLAPLVAVQAVLLAPLSEELLFRALLVPALARVVGLPGAIAGAALVFACAHPGFLSLAPMFVLGALFAWLYVTSPDRSLVSAITAHALYNALSLLLVVTVQLA